MSRIGEPNILEPHLLVSENTDIDYHLHELVNPTALIMHRPARPAWFVKVDIENNVVIKTDKAPKASKFRRSQRFVIQRL